MCMICTSDYTDLVLNPCKQDYDSSLYECVWMCAGDCKHLHMNNIIFFIVSVHIP